MELTTVWFILIAILWTGYFVLEGFDFGVGMLMPVLGRGEDSEVRKRVLLNTIGPVWDGNEVWLLTAGGATFAAFPNWYATMFSGLYLPLLIILVALGSKWHLRTEDKVPVFVRSFTDPFARNFVYFFALAPGLTAVTVAVLLGERQPVGGIAPHLVLSGLAIVVLAGNAIPWHRPRMVGIAWALLLLTPPLVAAAGILLLPWTGLSSVDVSRPATAMGHFFSESFQRRTGAPLTIVGGDPRISALVALGAIVSYTTLRPSQRQAPPASVPATDTAELAEV